MYSYKSQHQYKSYNESYSKIMLSTEKCINYTHTYSENQAWTVINRFKIKLTKKKIKKK